ncbi:hypothetical protein D3C72_2048060 [compost metagenome]
MYAGEQVGVDDIGGIGLYDGLLVALGGIALLRGNEARANVREIGTHCARGEDCLTVGNRPRQH